MNALFKAIAFCSAAIAGVTQLQASVSHTLTYLQSSLTVDTVSTGDGLRSRVKYGQLNSGGMPCAPVLPFEVISFSVPYNAVDFTLSTTATDSVSITLDQPVEAADSVIYDTNGNPHPLSKTPDHHYAYTRHAEIMSVSFEGGINKIVTVAVNPFTSTGQRLTMQRSVTVTLSWSLATDLAATGLQPVFPSNAEYSAEVAERLMSRVVNRTALTRNRAIRLAPRQSDDQRNVEYMIVTSRELAPAFDRLLTLRRSKGYTSDIFCIEDIVADPRFADGDVISGINDDAGKLRAFLRHAFENYGTRYVLLGGKPPVMPIRYAHVNIKYSKGYADTNAVYYEHHTIPSDLYFSELNSSWNRDGDQYYGEYKEVEDFNCELQIGRLLCTTQEQICAYIDKLLIYELDPGHGDTSYLKRAMISVSSEGEEYYENFLLPSLQLYFAKVISLQQNVNIASNSFYPKGGDIIKALNQTPAGFVHFYCHGTPECILTIDTTDDHIELPAYGISALGGVAEYPLISESDGINSLTNKNYPCWSFQTACGTMPFDRYRNYASILNFGESFTLGKDYGGVIYIGNTRNGYFKTSDTFESFMFFLGYANMPIGEKFTESKAKLIYETNGSLSPIVTHYVAHSTNLLGDPCIVVWPTSPNKLSFTVTVDEETVYQIEGQNMFGRKLGKTCIGESFKETRSGLYVSEIQASTLAPNNLYTIYGENHIPLTLPLQLQNITIGGVQNITAPRLTIGYCINTAFAEGKIIFESGSNIVFNISGKVDFREGISIESGAKVTIKTSEYIQLPRIEIESGGKLIIEAPEVTISDSDAIKFPKGVEIIIKTN